MRIYTGHRRIALLYQLRRELVRLRQSRELRVAMERVERGIVDVTVAIRDHLTPALLSAEFEFQRFGVEMLLAAPWYRHLLVRWRLRRSRTWALVYPLIEAA